MKEIRGETKEEMWEIKKPHQLESGGQRKVEGLIWHNRMGDMEKERVMER